MEPVQPIDPTFVLLSVVVVAVFILIVVWCCRSRSLEPAQARRRKGKGRVCFRKCRGGCRGGKRDKKRCGKRCKKVCNNEKHLKADLFRGTWNMTVDEDIRVVAFHNDPEMGLFLYFPNELEDDKFPIEFSKGGFTLTDDELLMFFTPLGNGYTARITDGSIDGILNITFERA